MAENEDKKSENTAIDNAVSEIKAAFRQAVKTAINGDSKHGWGAQDSLDVIVAVAAQWAENVEDVRVEDKVYETFQAAVKEVVNPSQFRQKIEGTEEQVKAGKALLVKSETRKEKVKGLVDELL